MRRMTTQITGLLALVLADFAPASAQMATPDEARNVAANWIALTIHQRGDWDGFESAAVTAVEELRRGDRVLGYFCRVMPRGYVVTSLRKELAAVKAFSATCDLQPEVDRGLTDVIKGGMERMLDSIEKQLGPIESVQTADLLQILEIDYSSSWRLLGRDVSDFAQLLESGGPRIDYQEGGILLSSSWHQHAPYNALCPTGDTGCTDCCPADPNNICFPTFPTLVGCVATAGAQIMRHWAWPPYGSGSHSYTWDGDDSCGNNVGGGTLNATFSDRYDWPGMANRYVWDPNDARWEDDTGNPLTQAQLDAVAELCYEVAVAVEMDFGVCGSGANTDEMEGVYEDHCRYSDQCRRQDRIWFSAQDWFDAMVSQFNRNRPVQYRVPGHSIVGDGWQIVGSLRQYHMNYGWDGVVPDEPEWAGYTTSNTWYTLDALPGSGPLDEYMLEDIYPARALGHNPEGVYEADPGFPYRYFDRDATANWAWFGSGHRLQFLPHVTVTCGGVGGSIGFHGYSPTHTRLFTRGDESRGVRIHDGKIVLYTGGSIVFR